MILFKKGKKLFVARGGPLNVFRDEILCLISLTGHFLMAGRQVAVQALKNGVSDEPTIRRGGKKAQISSKSDQRYSVNKFRRKTRRVINLATENGDSERKRERKEGREALCPILQVEIKG